MTRQHIIAIGAGVAGLVAARRLAQAGHSVMALETGQKPGGRVGQREVRGIRFNAGALLIYSFSTAFNQFLQETGLGGEFVPVHGLSALRDQGSTGGLTFYDGSSSRLTSVSSR